jgi:protoheme IX farnesyltransferase
MYKEIKSFFKLGIVYFVLISAVAGYGIGFNIEQSFSYIHFTLFILGTFLISAGSLSLNQYQEIENDQKMDRTKDRPLAKGMISKTKALSVSLSFLLIGLTILYFIKPLTFWVGVSIIAMYNGLYTMYWKRKWAFAAVPGAVPGALPGVLGFSAVDDRIFSSPSVYLFLVMFLWQMPHFWTLAILYKDDYKKGNFPVLPSIVGAGRAKYHISFYVWCYALLGVMSPFFVDFLYAYFILVLPFSIIVVWQFLKYFKSDNPKAWLPFFLVTNFSMLAFIFAPLIDKWTMILFKV